jgi:hypothetical protein
VSPAVEREIAAAVMQAADEVSQRLSAEPAEQYLTRKIERAA